MIFSPQVGINGRIPLATFGSVSLTYSVVWENTDAPYDERYAKFVKPEFFQHRIHWFSIVNSFMLCLFLCGIVAVILTKTLKKDFTKYATSDELDGLELDMSCMVNSGEDVGRELDVVDRVSVWWSRAGGCVNVVMR